VTADSLQNRDNRPGELVARHPTVMQRLAINDNRLSAQSARA
jgi:hypothetical protein